MNQNAKKNSTFIFADLFIIANIYHVWYHTMYTKSVCPYVCCFRWIFWLYPYHQRTCKWEWQMRTMWSSLLNVILTITQASNQFFTIWVYTNSENIQDMQEMIFVRFMETVINRRSLGASIERWSLEWGRFKDIFKIPFHSVDKGYPVRDRKEIFPLPHVCRKMLGLISRADALAYSNPSL